MGVTRRTIMSLAATAGLAGTASAGETDAEALGWGEGAWGESGWGGLPEPRVDECFIATAAEGSKDHEHVVELRAFRDRVLRRHAAGRLFIRTYYATSPPVARWIARSERRKRATRVALVRPLSKIVQQ